GLVRIKAVPVIGFGDRVPRPVRLFGVDKDDAGVGIGVVVVGPDVIAPRRRAGLGPAGALEPGVLVRGVVDHQLGDDAHVAGVGPGDDAAEIGEGAVIGVDAAVVGDVVAVVAPRRGI